MAAMKVRKSADQTAVYSAEMKAGSKAVGLVKKMVAQMAGMKVHTMADPMAAHLAEMTETKKVESKAVSKAVMKAHKSAGQMAVY